MSVVELSLVLILLLFVILGTGVWIAIALAVCGFAAVMTKVSVPAGQVFATSVWAASDSWDLTALPMFIWMGEILYRTRLSEDMFDGLAPWVQKLPGRLLHVNVVGCAIFAAVSGSSAATCATIGRISLPQLLKRGYDERMAIGTLSGSGTLGLLIPPSIIMIVYATATDQSIARLFIAGCFPASCWPACSWALSSCGLCSTKAACHRLIRRCHGASASMRRAALSRSYCLSSV
jgi:C4-dicarboxylate transporter, DctM subunit